MAIARKCDRCGNLYETYNTKNDKTKINGLITINLDDNQKYFGHWAMDLCPDCMREFQNWLNEVK